MIHLLGSICSVPPSRRMCLCGSERFPVKFGPTEAAAGLASVSLERHNEIR
jgi:hypothetical protein